MKAKFRDSDFYSGYEFMPLLQKKPRYTTKPKQLIKTESGV